MPRKRSVPRDVERPASRVMERTRRTIIEAAMATWAGDRNATLGDICDAAGVGRSTLHRYFADRAALLAAVDDECHRRFNAAAARAHPDDGPALEAMLRLCQELLELGEPLSLIFSDNALINPDDWSDASRADQGLSGVITRGQRDGTIDPALPADWVTAVMWMLLFCAWQRGRDGGSRRETVALLARSLAGAIGTAPDH